MSEYTKEKLSEVILEYIEDDDSSIVSFHNDLVSVLSDAIDSNETRVAKLRGIREIINGPSDYDKPVDNQQEYIDKHNPWKEIPSRY